MMTLFYQDHLKKPLPDLGLQVPVPAQAKAVLVQEGVLERVDLRNVLALPLTPDTARLVVELIGKACRLTHQLLSPCRMSWHVLFQHSNMISPRRQ